MTRRSFLAHLGAACAVLGLPVVVHRPKLVASLDPAFRRDSTTVRYCWASQTDDGLFVSGGTSLSIYDPLSGRSVEFEHYRMADIPKLCDVVRAMRA